MSDSTTRSFGLVVAYIVPGFVGLAGLTPIFPVVGTWLQPIDQSDLGFGPPIYALLGATAVGLIVSCFRWILLDQLHHWTGVRRPELNDGQLTESLAGFDYLVQSHFRYYEFCGNTLIAGLWAYGVHRVASTLPSLGLSTDAGMAILVLVLFSASRDALKKYFKRTAALVGHIAEKAEKR